MLAAIAGGALQGLELTYLARKGGYDTILLDKNRDAPATGLCDGFVALDFKERDALTQALSQADVVFPATENPDALASLVDWSNSTGTPLAFDPNAFAISSSKKSSDALFREHGVPAPAPWPDCTFPVLAKPDSESGSKGVEVFADPVDLEERFDLIPPPGRVLQEYVPGPSYSIEVVGRPGTYTPLQITELEMDSDHDCKRVLAPTTLAATLAERFNELAVRLADAISLTGIMDVEVILHDGRLLVLEIDARFPSQTPIAVYHSTSVNMIERVAALFTDSENNHLASSAAHEPKGSILEHIRVRGGQLSVCGENVMVGNGPLNLVDDFFGADEALTSYSPGKRDWVATLMITGTDLADARANRESVIADIRKRFGIDVYRDEFPTVQIGHES